MCQWLTTRVPGRLPPVVRRAAFLQAFHLYMWRAPDRAAGKHGLSFFCLFRLHTYNCMKSHRWKIMTYLDPPYEHARFFRKWVGG